MSTYWFQYEETGCLTSPGGVTCETGCTCTCTSAHIRCRLVFGDVAGVFIITIHKPEAVNLIYMYLLF